MIASIDIGSNTVLMLLAEERGGVWSGVRDHAEITRISEGLDGSGVLAEGAILRTIQALSGFVEIARNAGASEILATGTAPFRRSANGEEVAARIGTELGITVEVVSGEREAELSLLATTHSFPAYDEMYVVDIGGASTEVIAFGSPHAPMQSLDIGSVRLTERCVRNDPPDAADRARLEAALEQALDRVDVRLSAAAPLVGIAGTVTTVACLDLELADWDADRVHGHVMSAARVGDIAEELIGRSVAERAAMTGMEPKRADVIAAGALLLARLMERLSVQRLIVSDRGLRWGRLYEHKA